ncbi:MAG: hypothetical protein K1X83_07840 [Oligoflexia bacterium]|nr:hypothetical protein [Oligoflexia bacterium]
MFRKLIFAGLAFCGWNAAHHMDIPILSPQVESMNQQDLKAELSSDMDQYCGYVSASNCPSQLGSFLEMCLGSADGELEPEEVVSRANCFMRRYTRYLITQMCADAQNYECDYKISAKFESCFDREIPSDPEEWAKLGIFKNGYKAGQHVAECVLGA